MSKVAISVSDLGKSYRIRRGGGSSPAYCTLRDEVIDLPRRLWASLSSKRSDDEFWALREVSFKVERGEVLGVIGRNGAGKSSLLKILSRVVQPSTGTVDVYGRVGSLLEVGTGFHPELTGRENVFLSGAILGMRRAEIASRLDEIVAFAGVERFLDTPCKHYSSGMYARLGFAVAAHLEADILLLDEILSVGDAEFRLRCQNKIREVMGGEGRTIIMVSHDFAVVRALCDRVLWIDRGRVAGHGATSELIADYHRVAATESDLIVGGVCRLVDGLSISRIRVGESETRRVVLAAGVTDLHIEVQGHSEHRIRMAIEARLYDADNVLIGLYSPGHSHGRVSSYDSGSFIISTTMRLPHLLRGLFRLRIELTDPNVAGWMDTGASIDLMVEGVPTATGAIFAGPQCGYQLIPEA